MTRNELGAMLTSWAAAVDTLAEALALEGTPIVRDACIKRFEYCFELVWKIIKQSAYDEGEDCNSPRSAFRTAFRLGWIDDDAAWLDMLDDRNLTTHTYKEQTAEQVYARLPGYLAKYRQLHGALRERLGDGKVDRGS